MKARILIVGGDESLLSTRRQVLASEGYDADVATPREVDGKLAGHHYDLVILSVLLGEEEQSRIEAKLAAGTKALILRRLVGPRDLLKMVAEELKA